MHYDDLMRLTLEYVHESHKGSAKAWSGVTKAREAQKGISDFEGAQRLTDAQAATSPAMYEYHCRLVETGLAQAEPKKYEGKDRKPDAAVFEKWLSEKLEKEESEKSEKPKTEKPKKSKTENLEFENSGKAKKAEAEIVGMTKLENAELQKSALALESGQ